MGSLGFFESVMNVCRTWTDIFHILFYVGLVFVAIMFAAYKYDEKVYNKFFYEPLNSVWKYIKETFTIFSIVFSGFFQKTKKNNVEVKSNRKTYRGRKRK